MRVAAGQLSVMPDLIRHLGLFALIVHLDTWTPHQVRGDATNNEVVGLPLKLARRAANDFIFVIKLVKHDKAAFFCLGQIIALKVL